MPGSAEGKHRDANADLAQGQQGTLKHFGGGMDVVRVVIGLVATAHNVPAGIRREPAPALRPAPGAWDFMARSCLNPRAAVAALMPIPHNPCRPSSIVSISMLSQHEGAEGA